MLECFDLQGHHSLSSFFIVKEPEFITHVTELTNQKLSIHIHSLDIYTVNKETCFNQ